MKNIILKKGKKPGKTVAIFSGVHGNEKAGVEAIKKVIKKIEIISGKVYFVFANPHAINKNVRYVEKNLNRCFLKNNKGKTLEDKIAVNLMKILDESDLLLDLHASNTPQSTPFIICEKNGYDIAEKLDFEIISSGWDKFEPGATDGYMLNSGKIGICLECGFADDMDKGIKIAEKSIFQFLKHTKSINGVIGYTKRKRKFINVIKMKKKKTEDFAFTKKFSDFEILKEGEVFAYDGALEYKAGKNECIIFPNLNKKVGEEFFLIGKIK